MFYFWRPKNILGSLFINFALTITAFNHWILLFQILGKNESPFEEVVKSISLTPVLIRYVFPSTPKRKCQKLSTDEFDLLRLTTEPIFSNLLPIHLKSRCVYSNLFRYIYISIYILIFSAILALCHRICNGCGKKCPLPTHTDVILILRHGLVVVIDVKSVTLLWLRICL